MPRKRIDRAAEARNALASLLQIAYIDAYIGENRYHDHPSWKGCDKVPSNRPIAEAVAEQLLTPKRRLELLEILKQMEGRP